MAAAPSILWHCSYIKFVIGVRVGRTAKRDTLLNCSALKSMKCYQRMKNCAKNMIELLSCLYTTSGFSVHKWFNSAYEQWVVLLNLDHYLLWNSSAHFPATCCLCNTYCICLIFWTQISIWWTTQRHATKPDRKSCVVFQTSRNVLKVMPCESSSRASLKAVIWRNLIELHSAADAVVPLHRAISGLRVKQFSFWQLVSKCPTFTDDHY